MAKKPPHDTAKPIASSKSRAPLRTSRDSGKKGISSGSNSTDDTLSPRRKINLTLRRKFRDKLTFTRLLPNIVTLGALSAGLTSVRFALDDKWELAVVAIILAGLLDALDGRVARYLNQSTHFGGELDSLSDVISFGVAPALILYMKSLHHLGTVGWTLAVGYVVCMALRLARFNTLNIETQNLCLKGSEAITPPNQGWEKAFFVGVPAPAGAVLLLLPLFLEIDQGAAFGIHPVIVSFYTIIVCFLLVSQIATYSLKGHVVKPKLALPLLLGAGLLLACLFSAPWITLTLSCVGYYVSIYFSWRAYRKYLKEIP